LFAKVAEPDPLSCLAFGLNWVACTRLWENVSFAGLGVGSLQKALVKCLPLLA